MLCLSWCASIVCGVRDYAGKPLLYSEVNSTGITAQIFGRPLSGKRAAFVLFNRREAAATMQVSLAAMGLPAGSALPVRDVVLRKDMPAATGSYSALVPAHGVAFVVVG